MKDFYFDLQQPHRPAPWLRAGLLLAGAASLAAVLAYAQWSLFPRLGEQRRLLQAEAASIGGPVSGNGMKPAELAQAWQRAREVSTQLGLPWAQLFAELGEAGVHSKVALVSIEPEPLKGQLVLVAEAGSLDKMLLFVGALQESPAFTEVALQSHSVNKQSPEQPVRFRVNARWKVAE